jgi:hypothetical protein
VTVVHVVGLAGRAVDSTKPLMHRYEKQRAMAVLSQPSCVFAGACGSAGFVCLFVCLFVRSFTRSLVRSFACSLVC